MARTDNIEKKKGSAGRTILCIFLILVMIVELGIVGLKYPGILNRGDDKYNTEIGSYPTTAEEEWTVVASESATMPQNGGEVTVCGVTVSSDEENLAADETVSVTDYGTKSFDGEETHRFNITMGEHRQFDVPVAVSIPVRLGDDEDIAVLHHIEETDEWVPMAAEYDKESGTVTAYFSSFCDIETKTKKKNVNEKLYYIEKGTNKYGEASTQSARMEVSKYYWSVLKDLDSKNLSDEAIKFVADPSLYAQDFEKYRDSYKRDEDAALDSSNVAFTVMGPILDITSQIPASMGSVKFDYAEPMGNALGWVTLTLASFQTLRDFRDAGGDWNAIPAPATNAYKNLFSGSGSFYSFLSGYGSIGFSIAFVGVTLVAFELDKTIESAKLAMSARTADVFDAYFTKVAPFDKNDWYRAFKDAYYNSNNDPNVAMSKISDKINRTVEGFWTDIYNEENIDVLVAAAEADTQNLFTRNNIYFYNVTDEEKAALNAQMKQELWKKFKKETMPLVDRFLVEKLQENVYAKLWEFTVPFNNYIDLNIMETLPEAGEDDEDEPVARYAGCTLCLGHGNEPVKGWDPVTIPEEMTEGWQTEYSCTVLGYLEEKCPDTLLVYESEDDIYSGKAPIYSRSFTVDITGKEITTIDLGSGNRAEEEALVADDWYIGLWCREPEGNGNAIALEPYFDEPNRVVVTQLQVSSAEEGSNITKYRGTYIAEVKVGPNEEYIIIPQSEPGPDGEYFSAIKIFKPKDDPNVLQVIYGPKEETGDEGTEGKGKLYKRGGAG